MKCKICEGERFSHRVNYPFGKKSRARHSYECLSCGRVQ